MNVYWVVTICAAVLWPLLRWGFHAAARLNYLERQERERREDS